MKEVEPYTIVGGNPAKPLKKRFEDNIIKALLEIKWWEWSVEKIEGNLNLITGADIEALVKKHNTIK